MRGSASRTPRILLAGGGTAGHLAPGFALAGVLARRGIEARFVTPGEAKERVWFPAGVEEPLHVPAPRLPTTKAAVPRFAVRLAFGVAKGRALLRRVRPDVVVALGGWPCAPLALAALSSKVPLALLAADAVPGLVVTRLARFAGRTYVASEGAKAVLGGGERIVVVGRAVRHEVLSGRRDPARFGLAEGRATLLVMGGSLGATGLNLAVRRGFSEAIERRPELAARVQVIHSTGAAAGEESGAAAAYRALGLPAFVTPYLTDVANALATADLVLCRAGASTVAEVEATGRPAVFVPYPHHADRQQFKNAAPLAERGAAAVVEEGTLDAGTFDQEVLGRLLDRARLAAMERAGAGGPPRADAAALAADDLVRWMGMAASEPRPSRSPRREVAPSSPSALPRTAA